MKYFKDELIGKVNEIEELIEQEAQKREAVFDNKGREWHDSDEASHWKSGMDSVEQSWNIILDLKKMVNRIPDCNSMYAKLSGEIEEFL